MAEDFRKSEPAYDRDPEGWPSSGCQTLLVTLAVWAAVVSLTVVLLLALDLFNQG